MRLRFVLAALAVASLSTSIFACTAPSADSEDVDTDGAELVQFPAAAFAGAVPLAYGQTSAAIDYRRGVWGVIKFAGTAGEEMLATVTPTTADRLARAYLVHKRADGKYVAILSGTAANDGLVKAKLEETKDYYVVFREYRRRNASFTVKLELADAPAPACAGTPLLDQDIVDRTLQAQEPGFTVTGTFESNIRRCNVATGCTDPVRVQNANASISLRKSGASWQVVGSGVTATHDGTTAELAGTTSLRADDGRNIPVALKGRASTGCISLSGRARSEVDAITYYDVDVNLVATTPALADRVAQPALPPPTECEGQDAISDEELLARFARGAASAMLGRGFTMEDTQYCHPRTGCRPWARNRADGYQYEAQAYVLGVDQLGVDFWSTRGGSRTAKFVVDDGAVQVNRAVLRAGAQDVASVSDTHLFLREANVFTSGDTKYRRYVCIPIPAHP